MKRIFGLAALVGFAGAFDTASANLAVLNVIPDAALSVDGLGVVGAGTGNLQAEVPAGSTVAKAYLYTASVWSSSVNSVTFNGSTLNPGAGTTLAPNVNPATTVRYDVTGLVKPTIDGGGGGIYNFPLQELGNNDGSVLVVAYANPATIGGTAILLDGELATAGDSTTVSFAPYTGGNFLVSLADSFGYNGPPGTTGQVTLIDIVTSSLATRRLTGCAGGNDDGVPPFVAADGALITAGGVGDSPANPAPTCTGGADDDEYYNLAVGNSASASPFIAVGDTSLTLNTRNPSADDNVFGLFISSQFKAEVPVPEPGTLALLGLGLLPAVRTGRRRFGRG